MCSVELGGAKTYPCLHLAGDAWSLVDELEEVAVGVGCALLPSLWWCH